MGETHTARNGTNFKGKFKLDTYGKDPMTPAKPGKVIIKGGNKVTVSKEDHHTYRLGVGKMLHMML